LRAPREVIKISANLDAHDFLRIFNQGHPLNDKKSVLLVLFALIGGLLFGFSWELQAQEEEHLQHLLKLPNSGGFIKVAALLSK
jgi:hypothetical protein